MIIIKVNLLVGHTTLDYLLEESVMFDTEQRLVLLPVNEHLMFLNPVGRKKINMVEIVIRAAENEQIDSQTRDLSMAKMMRLDKFKNEVSVVCVIYPLKMGK